jgi:hypothetical protein
METQEILLVDKMWKINNIVNDIHVFLKTKKIEMDYYNALELKNYFFSLDVLMTSVLTELEGKEND